jgi:hypothetical protein
MAKDLGRRSHDRRILGESLGKLQGRIGTSNLSPFPGRVLRSLETYRYHQHHLLEYPGVEAFSELQPRIRGSLQFDPFPLSRWIELHGGPLGQDSPQAGCRWTSTRLELPNG